MAVHPISRTKQAQREESRAAILSAAARVFADTGLAGARTDAIAAAAGVNKALLYYYFKSKKRLYGAVFEEHFRGFNDAALKVLTGTGSARCVLLQYVDLHFESISRNHRFAPLHQQFMMNGGQMLRPLITKYAQPRTDALRRLLERGIEDGEFRRVDVRHAAISITSLIVHYFSIAPILKLVSPVDAYSDAELGRRKSEVIEFIRYALFRDPAAPVS